MLGRASPSRMIAPPEPTVLGCGAMIFTLKAALSAWGFGPVIKWIAGRVQHIPASAWLSGESVRAAERVVATAGALYPGRARCLEQSLVLYYLLRRHGVAVKYCHGVMEIGRAHV